MTGSTSTGKVGFESYLKRVKKYFKIPIAVGFGISSRKDVQMVEKYADIVVVGSAVLEIINTYARFDVAIKKINTLIKTLTNKEQIIF